MLEFRSSRVPRHVELRLSARPESVRRARSLVDDFGRELGVPLAQRDDLRLATSEVVANAVLHAAANVVVRVSEVRRGIRVEVHDDGPGAPELLGWDQSRASGRGLAIVEALTRRWGVRLDPGPLGKVVWFELSLSKLRWRRRPLRAPVLRPDRAGATGERRRPDGEPSLA
jgi:serine/threonine-protein kinase RsbW